MKRFVKTDSNFERRSILKLPLFTYIDQVIAVKKSLRFDIQDAKKALDQHFLSIFEGHSCFVNYSSRIKEDSSLKEKIIRQNLEKVAALPEDIFQIVPDIIGCRIECRFLSDEQVIFSELCRHFSKIGADGYAVADTDPRIALRLSDPQPASQKNGYKSYRIDGRFLGDHVLNFELQIKSIVNVFWNEIDHKILYKNYNYIVSEQFLREIMQSVMTDLTMIDHQLQMMYHHIQEMDEPGLFDSNDQIKRMLGRVIQDVYVRPLYQKTQIVFDFRDETDLITDFLVARVKYESRESYAIEFLRILDDAVIAEPSLNLFGETISFDPPVHYYNSVTKRMGARLERAINEDLGWNLLMHILMDLNKHLKKEALFRTFMDYLYFRIVHTFRGNLPDREWGESEKERYVDRQVESLLEKLLENPLPGFFTEEGLAVWIGENNEDKNQ